MQKIDKVHYENHFTLVMSKSRICFLVVKMKTQLLSGLFSIKAADVQPLKISRSVSQSKALLLFLSNSSSVLLRQKWNLKWEPKLSESTARFFVQPQWNETLDARKFIISVTRLCSADYPWPQKVTLFLEIGLKKKQKKKTRPNSCMKWSPAQSQTISRDVFPSPGRKPIHVFRTLLVC